MDRSVYKCGRANSRDLMKVDRGTVRADYSGASGFEHRFLLG